MKTNTDKVLEATKIDKIPVLLQTLMKDGAIGGKLILAATILALIVANSPLNTVYQEFWNYNLTLGFSNFTISMSLSHWVSEGLMAIFFLVVGLEVKRELVNGQLRNPRTALLPIGAAIGGMIVPAIIFVLINNGSPETLCGWAIPIATDIAFALGVLSLLGNRVSSSLKLFLLTLAIVDDIGAIIIIALFYNSGLDPVFLLAALGLVGVIVILNKLKLMSVLLFIFLGTVLWILTYKSGVHASIAGALLGLLAPLSIYRESSIAEKLEKMTIPLSTFIVVPLFAFASLGITLSIGSFNRDSLPLVYGILAGLVIGKVVGVTFTSWILVKSKLAILPEKTNWAQLTGVGFLAGIGFTVSVFISELAFSNSSSFTNTAKMSVLIASTVSAIIGYFLLRHRKKVQAIFAAASE